MSLSWRNEVTVALGREGAHALPALQPRSKVTVVLSSYHVRYALLPWSGNLGREAEWQAYAQHQFRRTYGAVADSWEVCVSPSPKGAARVACAVERSLRAELRSAIASAGAKLVSVQPGLMYAFNAHRRDFRGEPGWLVAAEQGRLILALIANGLWEFVRVRNVTEAWRDELGAILRREAMLARREVPVERVVHA